MLVEETAGDGGVLSNLLIQGCFEGIVIKKNIPVMNNFFFSVMRPIVASGQKDFLIVNNDIAYYGLYNDGPGNPWAGIDVYTEPSEPNVISGQCNIMIAGNTIDDGGCGIKIHGHWCKNCVKYLDNPLGPGEPNNPNPPILNPEYHDPNTVSPIVYCVNNITSTQYYVAYGFYDGIVTPVILNPGFGAILGQTCNMPVPFENEAWVYEYPYEYDGGYRGHFLNEHCGFKSKGLGEIADLPWLLGTTTSLSFEPDDCAIDLGVHYHHSVSNSVKSFDKTDLNQDFWTNVLDFASFSSAWGKITRVEKFIGDPNDFYIDPNSIAYKSDFNEDGVVDIGDLVVFLDSWLVREIQENPQYELSFDQDLSSVSGVLNMTLTGNTLNASEIFLKIGTELVGRFSPDEEVPGTYYLGLDTLEFGNGFHQIQVVSIEEPNSVVIMPPVPADFHNLLSNNLPHDYYTASGYFISGTYAGSKSLSLTVSRNGSTVYSRILAASSVINAHIPKEVFSDNDWVLNYEVSLSELDEPNAPAPLSAGLGSAGMFLASAGETTPPYKEWKKNVYEKFDKDAYDPNVIRRVLFLLPDKKVTKMRWDVISSEMEACRDRNLRSIVLFYKDVNHVNLDFVFGDVKRLNTVFYHGHANYRTLGDDEYIERTFFQCWRKKVVKWFPDFYVESRAFSGKSTINPLPDDWDTEGFFLWPYNLGMRYVLADGCNTAVNSDLFSAFCRNDNRYVNRSLCGWKTPIHIGTGIWDGLTFSDEGLVEMAETLGRNDHLERALQNISILSNSVKREFWGADFIPGGEKDNFGTYLSQFGAFHEIYLAHGR